MKIFTLASIKNALDNINEEKSSNKNISFVLEEFDLKLFQFDFDLDWQKEVTLGSIVLSSEHPQYMKKESILIEKLDLSEQPSIRFSYIDRYEETILQQEKLIEATKKVLSYKSNSSNTNGSAESLIDQPTLHKMSHLFLILTEELNYKLEFDDDLYQDLVNLSSEMHTMKNYDSSNIHVTELNIPSNLLSKYKDRVASLKIKEKLAGMIDI